MGIGTITFPFLTGAPISFGVSEAAAFIGHRYRDSVQGLKETVTLGLGVTDSVRELALLYAECRRNDWDGYGALPVSQSAYELASFFLDALPLGTPAPTIGAEPDGQIALEWYRSPRRTLSVSVSPQGDLHYAALLGTSKQHGTEPLFSGEIPTPILELIFRVMAA